MQPQTTSQKDDARLSGSDFIGAQSWQNQENNLAKACLSASNLQFMSMFFHQKTAENHSLRTLDNASFHLELIFLS